MSSSKKDIFMVIGGSGFLGRHIVQQLLDRGDLVSVFDIVQRYSDVPFYSGDISEEEQVAAALRKCGATCIIHTASPPAGLSDPALYWKVNVDGTKAVIAAAQSVGVRKLVFTSSAGVVFNGSDNIDVDERLPFPEKPMDAYNESKAKAEEAVLAANGVNGLLTVALRPAGIFGPGDRQVMAGLYQVYERGQTHFQIGDNNNLFDWTYVGNVAYAHLLAADKLQEPVVDTDSSKLTPQEEAIISYPLPSIEHTTRGQRIPTSEARPLGPYVTPPPNADKILAAFTQPVPPKSNRPVVRSRFDALSDTSVLRMKAAANGTSPLQVAGEVFFITNGEPCYFWDFMRMVWHRLDSIFPEKRAQKKRAIVLPRAVGMAAATASEWVGWLIGKEPTFTRFKVTFSCVNRWHNIEKARRVLGYEPIVGVEEGVGRMVEWWQAEYAAGNHKIAHK
ncbi:erg26, C-3 sterol dehydrogenase [Pleurotus pulmonarius]|nr:erg26, C-3 sterol dehydrogenase [Pleurotus pulmonarius]KAF4590901.1 erg26, C-3 sterol dehydrogenase [Pleurotus pulmonarius]